MGRGSEVGEAILQHPAVAKIDQAALAVVEKRILTALRAPGQPKACKIAKRFGFDPSTVQRISRFVAGSVTSTTRRAGPWPLADRRNRKPDGGKGDFAGQFARLRATSPLGGSHASSKIDRRQAEAWGDIQNGRTQAQAPTHHRQHRRRPPRLSSLAAERGVLG